MGARARARVCVCCVGGVSVVVVVVVVVVVCVCAASLVRRSQPRCAAVAKSEPAAPHCAMHILVRVSCPGTWPLRVKSCVPAICLPDVAPARHPMTPGTSPASSRFQGLSAWRPPNQPCDKATASGCMDTLGVEPRASRMLSGCDTTTPRALGMPGQERISLFFFPKAKSQRSFGLSVADSSLRGQHSRRML